jgi:uncharacterized protein YbjQ (UPF0145 family)
MSNYGQPPAGQTPYGPQNPYGQPQQPYQRPAQPYGQPAPYGQAPQPPYAPASQAPYGQASQAPYGQANQAPYGQANQAPYGQANQAPYGQANAYSPGQAQPQPGQWPAPGPSAPKPGLVPRALVVVTMDAVPGREVTGVLGDVVGVVARSRELPQELRTPDPLDGYARMLTNSRQEAVARMVAMAVAAGADAVVGLRFDSSEITQSLSEVSAYGTAVNLRPESESGAGPSGAEVAQEERSDGESPVQPLSPPDFVGVPEFDSGTSDGETTVPQASGTSGGSHTLEPAPGSGPGGQDAAGQPWPPAQWSRGT